MEYYLHQLARMEHQLREQQLREGPSTPRSASNRWVLRFKRTHQHTVVQSLRPALITLINLIAR